MVVVAVRRQSDPILRQSEPPIPIDIGCFLMVHGVRTVVLGLRARIVRAIPPLLVAPGNEEGDSHDKNREEADGNPHDQDIHSPAISRMVVLLFGHLPRIILFGSLATYC
jgi:hypothetical protein